MIDTEQLMNVLRDAARAEIMPRFRRLDTGSIRQKTEAIDLVTEADLAAERRIKAEVAARWPNAVFVGEESVAEDPALIDRLAGLDAGDVAVVVDPVDGTANFAAGLPLFATMAAVVQGGRTVAGIIYDPMGDDWFVAERGAGAFMKRPDGGSERLAVAKAPELSQMVGTVSTAFLPREKRREILGNLDKIRVPASYRVAGHEYRLLASGNTHFAMYNKLMPWDHLAGTLIVEEAGGYARRLDGSTYLPSHSSGGVLVTTDPQTWDLLRRDVFTL
ncbi:MAG TPA: inositol monophosphatase family protein [Devosia sp.]|nr:inositol monophosphatase family protein [Devosia sp.]